jgi:hypothetical protein
MGKLYVVEKGKQAANVPHINLPNLPQKIGLFGKRQAWQLEGYRAHP